MAMDFYSNDLYPQMLNGGRETSTDVTPDGNDQEVLAEDKEALDVTDRSQPRKVNLFLAIALVVLIAFLMGVTE